MKLLSPLDQMFARMEAPRTPMHIGAFAVFDLPKGAPRRFIRDLYEAISQLAFLPFPFDSVIAGGASMAYWRQVQPDPSYHVRLSALPYPGTGRNLGALVERLHSTPLDMAKPLWELHLIEGLTGRQFAMYFKAHHCAVDGLGGVNLIKSWLTTDPEAPQARASPSRSAMTTTWPACWPPPRRSGRSRAFPRSANWPEGYPAWCWAPTARCGRPSPPRVPRLTPASTGIDG